MVAVGTRIAPRPPGHRRHVDAKRSPRRALAVHRRGVPAPIGAAVPASLPVKSITWRDQIRADGGHCSISIHTRGRKSTE
jgi:hypothetical protein